MITVEVSDVFSNWLAGLKDARGRAKVLQRITRLRNGNPGDHRSVGGGIVEMRLTDGPGYRVYYTHRGKQLVVVLAGGDKSSQSGDIIKARQVAADWR